MSDFPRPGHDVTNDLFGPEYWMQLDRGSEPAIGTPLGASYGVEQDFIDPNNPQFCLTCPFNKGGTDGPVEGEAIGIGPDVDGGYVDFRWRDDNGNRTPALRLVFATDDGGFGSDEIEYAERWMGDLLRSCEVPIPSRERTIATLGLAKTVVPRCGVLYIKGEDGKARRRPGIN